jgi:hypothetical protein
MEVVHVQCFHNAWSKICGQQIDLLRIVRSSAIIQFKWPYFIYKLAKIYCESVIQFDVNGNNGVVH